MSNHYNDLLNKKVLCLKLITLVSYEQQMQARDIRNEADIREVTFTDHEISIDEHFCWIDKLRTDKTQIVFVIINEKHCVIGVISAINLDVIHRRSDWTFYLKSSARGGIGTVIEWHFLEFVFNKIGLEKLNGEVIQGNDYVIAHHKKFFFIEEGYRRSNIVKNGKQIGVHYVGLTKSDWVTYRLKVFEKYENLLSQYTVNISYECHTESV